MAAHRITTLDATEAIPPPLRSLPFLRPDALTGAFYKDCSIVADGRFASDSDANKQQGLKSTLLRRAYGRAALLPSTIYAAAARPQR